MIKRVEPALFFLAVFFLSALTGCGGGGSSTGGGGGGGNITDFNLIVQPGVVALTPGASSSMTVSVSGSAPSVSISISGVPAGVSASTTQFSLSNGAQQTINLTALATASSVSASVTVSGTAGSVNHSAKLALLVNPAQRLAHPPTRTGYLRTDAQWIGSFLQFAPQKWIIYNSLTHRFFASSTFLNRVDVIDAGTRQLVGTIPVPGAFVGDETPDHTAIYMGTQVGDVYKIDPVTMQVVQRFPSIQIGPTGFAAFEVRVLADGRLALLGGQGGIPAVDGFSAVAIWNPVDNSFFVAPRLGFSGCPFPDHISEFALTADRSRILLGSGVSGASLCSYDPVTDAQRSIVTDFLGIGLKSILTPPDGKEILVGDGAIVKVYDANELFLLDQFQIGNGQGFFYYLLSQDGATLYALTTLGAEALAVDWRTHQLKGWMPSMNFIDSDFSLCPMAADETGLIAAVASHGVSFLEGAAVIPGNPTTAISNSFVRPSFGPLSGGTDIQFTFIATPPSVDSVLFGNQLAANVGLLGEGASATSPAGNQGPVDVTALLPGGGLVLAPESFSYGPAIVEVATDSTTAEGGGTGRIFGYGFGTAGFGGQPAAGLQVQINGSPASNLKYSPNPLDSISSGPGYLLPIESLTFTFPPGSAGTLADIAVSDSAGSVQASQAVSYLPALRQFPLSGSVLVQGIYDAKRDVYYFSDATKVQVFSKTQGAWLAPISMPAGAARLWGLSLSPDGTKLAVSDAGTDQIYVLNPDLPASVKTFAASAPPLDSAGAEPAGLAITDSGIIYYMLFYTQLTGPPGLHKLDTTTGVITPFQSVAALALGSDALTRVLLSNDNTRAYINVNGFLVKIDTATDAQSFNPIIPGFDYELALSSNQTWMSATGWLMDTNLNPESFLTFTDRQGVSVQEVFGAKISPDGSLFFQPLVDGIDIFDGRLGTLRTRLALPISLSANYDALVADGKDNVLVAIAGTGGDGGIAVIDLDSLPLPPLLTRLGLLRANGNALPASANNAQVLQRNMRAAGMLKGVRRPADHIVNDVQGRTGLRILKSQ